MLQDALINHSRSPVPKNFQSIQSLRGIAALMVVVYHCMVMWSQRIAGYPEQSIPVQLSSGVDLFFVISGFVMVVSSKHLSVGADGWRIFLWRRFIRIVPFYWLVTTLRLVLVGLLPSLALHHFPGVINIVASFLFLPSLNPSGEVSPVVADGWTLSFEMLFYVIFAVALGTRAPLLRILVPALGLLAIIGLFRTDDWPTVTVLANPLVLEFLFGVCIGLAILRGSQWPLMPSLLAATVAAGVLMSAGTGPTIGAAPIVDKVDLRFLMWGLPAAVIVFAACSSEERLKLYLPSWVLMLGDASYSIYLIHSFVLVAVGVFVVKLHLKSMDIALVISIVLGTISSAIVGVFAYKLLEQPLLQKLRRISPEQKSVVKIRPGQAWRREP